MDVKLTLRMNDGVISNIKTFSRKHRISVSKLVELLFQELITRETKLNNDTAPITRKYKALIPGGKLNEDREKYSHLIKKHG